MKLAITSIALKCITAILCLVCFYSLQFRWDSVVEPDMLEVPGAGIMLFCIKWLSLIFAIAYTLWAAHIAYVSFERD